MSPIQMNLQKITNRFEKILQTATTVFSKFGQIILMAMVLMTVVDVILRRVFSKPLAGSLELSEIMLVIVVFSAIAYCGMQGSHVRIDALTSRFPRKFQAFLLRASYIIGVVLFGAMGCGSIKLAMDKFGNHSVTGMLPIPIYPFVFVMAFGSILLSLVLLLEFMKSLIRAEN